MHMACLFTAKMHGVFKMALDDADVQSSTVTEEESSADHRRVKRRRLEVEPPSPVKKQQRSGAHATSPDFTDLYDDLPINYIGDDTEVVETQTAESSWRNANSVCLAFLNPTFSHRDQDDPLREWIPLRDEYLRESIRVEGRGDCDHSCCPFCSSATPEYRCSDCFGTQLLCKSCFLQAHQYLPLHTVKVNIELPW